MRVLKEFVEPPCRLILSAVSVMLCPTIEELLTSFFSAPCNVILIAPLIPGFMGWATVT